MSMPATGSNWERIGNPTRKREREMDVEGGRSSEIQRLPEDCVSLVISLTSPRDACRLEAVSPLVRPVAASDYVWKSFLPSDYAEILDGAVDRVEFASMKQLYVRICDPILIDGGAMGFFVDRDTGVKCFILPARKLRIVWGDTPQYWSWIHHPESRFPEVAELREVCWLEIDGRIDSGILSKRSYYSAYLVFKLSNSASGLMVLPQEVSVTLGTHVSRSPVRLHAQAPHPAQGDREMVGKPQVRRDGWMEMLLGEFYNEEGDDGEVLMSLLIKTAIWKRGLIVEGIEIRPKKK